MAKFDVSNPADFSRITQQTINDVGSLFGKDPGEWDIVEAQYNEVTFHVFKSKQAWQGAVPRITDTGGRRKVKYQYPYRDGQTTDDLGRKPGGFELECIIFGQNYLQCYYQLLEQFNNPVPGTLKHPVLGALVCAVEDYTIIHESTSRKAMSIRVMFTEHNFTVGFINEIRTDDVKNALSGALAVFALVDQALTKIEAAQLLARAVKIRLNQLLGSYKSSSAATLTQMNATFNTRGGSADIPSLLPTNKGGTRNPDGTLSQTTFQIVRTPSDPFSAVPTDELQTTDTTLTAAVTDLTKQVVARRSEAAEIISTIESSGGSLELFDTILDLRKTVVLMQEVLETGVASSNARLVDYEVPRLMTIREIAFANGLSPNRSEEIDRLNPELDSVNYVPKGTVVKVPAA